MASGHGNTVPALWLLLALLLASLSAGMIGQTGQQGIDPALDGAEAATSARQVEADCDGLTFEDIFNYSYVHFDIDVYDTWDGALFNLVAYVNGSMAGDLRADVDELFDGLPGGNNSYLSSDERDGLEAVGMDCVVQTYTRAGFRAGPAHRGGQGVDWNNATWVREGMEISEFNMLPPDSPDKRDCRHPGRSPDCWEVPVYPSTEDDCGSTSCDLIVWLNGTVEFDEASDPNNFTFAMNMTNMSSVELDITLPLTTVDAGDLTGMRVKLAEECDGRDSSMAQTGGGATIPGECSSDGSTSVVSRMVDSNHLQVTVLATYDHGVWPLGQDLFIDFTTEPPPVDDPPEWTAAAPSDGDLLPVADVDTPQQIVNEEAIREWFSDELDPGMLSVGCSGADGWALTGGAANSWTVKQQTSGPTSVTCEATDLSGQVSGPRTFVVAVALDISAAATEVASSAVLTVISSAEAPDGMLVDVALLQGDSVVSSTVTLDSGTSGTVTLDVGALSPGPILVRVLASGAGMADMSHTYDLGLAKPSIPPTVTITGEEWVEGAFILSGNFHDADGEDVTFTLRVDGVEMGQVSVVDNTWRTGDIPMDLLFPPPYEGVYTVEVQACDESNVCTTVTLDVDNTFLFQEADDPISAMPVDDGGLPAPGLVWALFALLSASLLMRRRD